MVHPLGRSLTAREMKQKVIDDLNQQRPQGQYVESLYPSAKVVNFAANERIINLNSGLTAGQIRGENLMIRFHEKTLRRR